MQLTTCRHYMETEASHEIDGNLSYEYGFLPSKMPVDKLPGEYAIWDKMAAEIPALFYTNNTRNLLDQLKIITTDKLEDVYLPRAAIVLSILASAYWRHGIQKYFLIRNNLEHESLAPGILEPWKELTIRLKRGNDPYQSGADLFFNNFKIRQKTNASYQLSEVKIENLDVLVPSFNNDAERVFYMSFVDIHARTATVVKSICEIEDIISMPGKDLGKLAGLLDGITKTIKDSINSLMKISPMQQSKTYCDPVLWAKTVGVFALPPSNFVQGGTSGTSVPVLHVLDALIGRKKHESYYGEYVKNHGFRLLDYKTRGFVLRVSNLKLRDWILNNITDQSDYEKLVNSFNRMVESYAGTDGFLDKHISKVFNYLGVATLVGRNQSTSGHERHITTETWKKVCEDLKIAQYEREKLLVPVESIKEEPTDFTADYPEFSRMQVAGHYTPDNAWIIFDNSVYDVTKFIKMHPGGYEIICSYLGRDATKEFNSIQAHNKVQIKNMLEKMKIGVTAQEENNSAYMEQEALIHHLQKTFAILSMQKDRGSNIKMNTIFNFQAHNAFINEHLLKIVHFLNKTISIRANDILTVMDEIEIENSTDDRIAALHRLSIRYLNKEMVLLQELINLIVELQTKKELIKNEIFNKIKRWCKVNFKQQVSFTPLFEKTGEKLKIA